MAFERTYWSDLSEENLVRESPFVAFVRDDFEEEAKYGGKVKVYNYTDSITYTDYTGADVPRDDLEPTELTLDINKAKAFNVSVDNIVALKSGDKSGKAIAEFVKNATTGIAQIIDADLYAHKADVDAGNIKDTFIADKITVANILSVLEEINVTLDAVSAGNDRFVAVDARTASIIRLAGLAQTSYVDDKSVFGAQEILKYGKLTIVQSNLVVPTAGVLPIYGGTKDFIRFIFALQEIDSYKPESSFKDAVKGLFVWGSKVFNGKKGAVINVKDYAAV